MSAACLSVVDKTAASATTVKDRYNMPRVIDGWIEFNAEQQSYWSSRVTGAPATSM